MSCATSTVKYLFFIFNALFVLFGIVIVVIYTFALKNVTPDIQTSIFFMIALGSVICIVSFSGCFGAIRENTSFLWMYAMFLLLILAGNLALITAYSSDWDASERAQQMVDTAWELTLNGTDSMKCVQVEFGCCGKNSAQDYIAANRIIPESCYVSGNSKAGSADLFSSGCLYMVMEYYASADELLSVFRWTAISVECAMLMCACILARTFNNQKRRLRYKTLF